MGLFWVLDKLIHVLGTQEVLHWVEKLSAGNSRVFTMENIPSHLTWDASFWMQPVPALFTTTADLAFGKNSGALFSDFLAAGAQCCQELKLHCRASVHTVACFLVLSLSGILIQGEKDSQEALSFSSQCFPCLLVLWKEHTLFLRKEKAALIAGCCQVGLGVARSWSGPHSSA